jgi:hypothetical protein
MIEVSSTHTLVTFVSCHQLILHVVQTVLYLLSYVFDGATPYSLFRVQWASECLGGR